MKKQQKILIVVAIVALLVVSCFAFSACGKKYVQQKDTAVYFTVDKDVMANVDGKTLQDYMDALVEKKQLTYAGKESEFGIMLTSVNDLKADANKGEYWFIYSDDEENTTTEWAPAIEFEGKKYMSTKYGIKDMPIKEGASYLFMISSY